MQSFRSLSKPQGLGCQILIFGVYVSSWTINFINLIHQHIISIKSTAKIRFFCRFKKKCSPCTLKHLKGRQSPYWTLLDLIGAFGSQAISNYFSCLPTGIWRDLGWKKIQWLLPIVCLFLHAVLNIHWPKTSRYRSQFIESNGSCWDGAK